MHPRLPAFLVTMAIAFTVHAEERTPRILIVGDSWAASITAENRDGFPSPDVFDLALEANGLGRYETRGKVTAWGGRKASDWAKPIHLEEMKNELESHPTIDIVHLIVGGNDFLARAEKGVLAGLSDAERNVEWDSIIKDIRTIVDACLAIHENIRVVIAGYDYLDYETASRFWKKDFHDMSTQQLNQWLRELGDRKKQFAEETDRCEYINNWGTLQHWFGDPPKAVPYPGGDPAKGIPATVSPDGIHPDAKAHTRLLQNAIEAHYQKWLD